nr:hypothetical protein [uncultured Desulfobulbus sp.]
MERAAYQLLGEIPHCGSGREESVGLDAALIEQEVQLAPPINSVSRHWIFHAPLMHLLHRETILQQSGFTCKKKVFIGF